MKLLHLAGAGTILAAALLSACGDGASSENLTGNGSSSSTIKLSASSGTSLSGYFGNFVTGVPQVLVTNKQGHPLVNTAVSFVANGGGSLTGRAALTDSTGHASPTSWRLGPSGTQSVTASVTGANPLTITATASTAPAGSLHIEVRYAAGTTPTDAERAAFDAAAARWSQIILRGGVPYLIHEFDPGCSDLRGETVDGVVITAELKEIDGAGKILGASGPCILRDADYLPAQGIMQFDTADLAMLESRGQLETVIVHEMAHVLGFGTIWEIPAGAGFPQNAFLVRTNPDDPTFNGAASRGALYGLSAGGFVGTPVPVEATGGDGTAYSHWRETTFGPELMTGWINAGANPLSALTIDQFRDLGYVVNDALGEGYSFAAAVQAAVLAEPTEPIQIGEGKLSMPILVVNKAGYLVRRLDRVYK